MRVVRHEVAFYLQTFASFCRECIAETEALLNCVSGIVERGETLDERDHLPERLMEVSGGARLR
ncbi:hypothetical protein A6A06_01700 [Streptomyces sp. CB02923]|nr:hypothetical protein A6A06_01700 [Streptomyces sp. CB02923]